MTKNVTISVSDDLAKKMENFPEVNWSEVCRQAISRYIEEKEPKQKGELIENLETYLSGKFSTTEDKEKARKEEIERFTKKWGTPDSKANDEEASHHYVTLLKTQKVNLGNQTIVKLKISNDRILALTLREKVKKGLGEYDITLYDKNLEPLVEYFKSNGFTIGKAGLIQSEIANYVTEGDIAQARDLQHRGYHYFGLFAADKEDYVFIAYREGKPK